MYQSYVVNHDCSPFNLVLRVIDGVLFFQAAILAKGLAQHVLDLRIQRPKFVVGPALHCLENLGIDAQRIGFFLAHDLVNRTGVDDRLRAAFTAEDDQQIADHGCAAFRIQIDHIAF